MRSWASLIRLKRSESHFGTSEHSFVSVHATQINNPGCVTSSCSQSYSAYQPAISHHCECCMHQEVLHHTAKTLTRLWSPGAHLEQSSSPHYHRRAVVSPSAPGLLWRKLQSPAPLTDDVTAPTVRDHRPPAVEGRVEPSGPVPPPPPKRRHHPSVQRASARAYF